MSAETTVTIGDYIILKELGEGMLGKVFLAQHRFLKKLFVLKVLPTELAENKGFIERFETEVALLGTLDHPQIVKIVNVSCADGKYFLVTEAYPDALNLAQYLQKYHQLNEEEIWAIGKQVAAALDYAHQKNFGDEPIAHRGLKFNNILIEKREEEIGVKVADFGLSRIAGIGAVLARTYRHLWEIMAFKAGFEADEGDVEKLHGGFSQYYAFLAPEQKGKNVTSRDVDAKADVYSFGILLYYLLVGVFPEGFFPMPSECNLELKRNWDELIKQCLNVDPEKRPLFLSDFFKEAQAKTVHIYTPLKTESDEIEPLLTEMVVVQGGTFLRGSNHGARDEMPRHAIHLPSFAIDIHPIMNEQFIRFLTAMGTEKDDQNNDMIRLRDSRIRKNGGKLSIEPGYAKHPVVGVTWYGAIAYAKWIGKRLPTEAEWEVAAYGGLEGAQYPTGDDIERPQANFFNSDTTAVMSYPPNGYGLYDMAGNVYEWCMDWYGYLYYETSMQEPDNPQGPIQGVYRVLRGGCWKSLKDDMRCSHRHRNNPGVMNSTYGFRCASDK
ncbi:MAG: SUMF1/EgtB/PvdO family nonheme iron enzyme [Verrucomicrobia bacterium]|nr:SUMF1/EgtB/PvdO family nonheme iron enzyme [Verrucomicrobiota bacterium]